MTKQELLQNTWTISMMNASTYHVVLDRRVNGQWQKE